MRSRHVKAVLVVAVVAWFVIEHIRWKKDRKSLAEAATREEARLADERRGLKKAAARKYSVN